MSINLGANRPETRQVPIGTLKAYLDHPRTHSRHQRRKLEKLLRHFGQIAPVIIDEHNVIIDGHAVWEVMRALGYDDIAVVVVSGRNDADIKALRLALNRLPTDAGWDKPKLRNELQALLDLSYDMELTAFTAVEVDYYVDLAENDGEPPIPASQPEAVSKPGDIYVLGDHRVGCGNALDKDFVANVLNGSQAAIAFVDPPYNVAIDGFVAGNGNTKHREFAMASGEMTVAQFTEFLRNALLVLQASVTDGGVIYACMDWRHLLELLNAAGQVPLDLLNICVWGKTTPGLGSFYRSQHEMVVVLKTGQGEIRNNMALHGKRRNRSNLWTYRGMNAFGDDRSELVKLHPTIKPVVLVADVIRDVTIRGDLVLDTFLGSGSTLMAAEETGRRCYGTEIDPVYVDVIIRRWQQATKQDAVLAETGETFDDLAERRAASPMEVQHGRR